MTYIAGWLIVTVSYFITLFAALNIGGFIFPTQQDLGGDLHRVIEENILYLRTFVAVIMITVPYIVAGIYARRFVFYNPLKTAFWVSFIPVVFERLIIFIMGLIYLPRFVGEWHVSYVVPFIQANTPAFYFSNAYLVLGVISILIAVGIAKTSKEAETKKRMA